MAAQKTLAVVLKRSSFRETSYLLTLYTKDFGKISAICKGVRTQRLKRSSHFEVFNLLEILFYEKKHSDLFLLTESVAVDFFPRIRTDVERTGCASYLLELLNAAVGLHEANGDIFHLLTDTLSGFGLYDPGQLLGVFETRLLSIVGYLPDLERCSVCNQPLSGAFFVFRNANFVCARCRKPSMQGCIVSETARKTLQFRRARPLEQAWRLQCNSVVSRQMRSVLDYLISTRFEHNFQTLRFLNELGMLGTGRRTGLQVSR